MMPYPKETEIAANNPHYHCFEHQCQQLLVTTDTDPNNVIIADTQSNEFSPTKTQLVSQSRFWCFYSTQNLQILYIRVWNYSMELRTEIQNCGNDHLKKLY
jgi:hypothetical protein